MVHNKSDVFFAYRISEKNVVEGSRSRNSEILRTGYEDIVTDF